MFKNSKRVTRNFNIAMIGLAAIGAVVFTVGHLVK